MGYDLTAKAALLTELLSKPTGAFKAEARAVPNTREVERNGDNLTVTVPESAVEGTARDFLIAEGLSPDEWEVTGFRRSEWGEGKVSTRFTYKRAAGRAVGASLTDAELALLTQVPNRPVRPSQVPQHGLKTAIVAIADTQFGKYESPAAEVLSRVFSAIDTSVLKLAARTDVERVVVAFMGDHVEGFVSQGGKNVWRTQMPLTEQIRLTRRMMLYALDKFHSAGFALTMVGVPGNHDRAVSSPGMTTYDDSHDTEALLAVMDGARLHRKFDDVQFFVPETDELSVSLELSGTHTVFNHGYHARPYKFHDWAMRQGSDRGSMYHGAQLVVYGHHHHLHMEQQGERTVIVVPAAESDSMWYKHATGTGGAPAGVTLVYTGAGETNEIDIIRG